jgi:hypothetical protein
LKREKFVGPEKSNSEYFVSKVLQLSYQQELVMVFGGCDYLVLDGNNNYLDARRVAMDQSNSSQSRF